MKALIFGASGIIGQHLRLCVPPSIIPSFYRHREDPLTPGIDLTDNAALEDLLDQEHPDVIVNLAGQSAPDVVETDPERWQSLNVDCPALLAAWAEITGGHYVHISTQAVFGGNRAPYRAVAPGHPEAGDAPVNAYGVQKRLAEIRIAEAGERWSIIRPTFVCGVRPLFHVGRENPVEAMLQGKQPRQVSDRRFSPLLVNDAARLIWEQTAKREPRSVLHLGQPRAVSRYDIAQLLGVPIEPCAHASFDGIAPRALNTAYADDSRYIYGIEQALGICREEWSDWRTSSLRDRARELALFFCIAETEARTRLGLGFAQLHGAVARDFQRANPQTPEDLLAWYANTPTYVWELTAYHLDPGFNYAGMVTGLRERLLSLGIRRALCLGDGIGDLSLALRRAGVDAVYHDLSGSVTAAYAMFRYWRQTGERLPQRLSLDWRPDLGGPWDAILALDFCEHLPNVEDWVRAIHASLTPGGWFVAQNAFGLGSGPQGSIPMHLAANDRYERDWDSLLLASGFRQEGPQWYQKM